MERDSGVGRVQRYRRLARGGLARICLHPACMGLPSCVQTHHVPLCGAIAPTVTPYRRGDELRAVFSAELPDSEVENPVIQQGTTEMTSPIDYYNVLFTAM
jgi:hypothetical protein